MLQDYLDIKKIYDNAKLIFLVPPSLKDLENRLIKRNLDSSESIEKRLAEAKKEIKKSKKYDFLVLPSETEGFPMIIIECMALGLPFITTRVGAIEEIVGKDYPYFCEKEKNSLIFKTRRNRKISLTEYYDLVYEYQNDCLTAGIKYRKTYYQDRDLKPKEDLFFTITLFPLTTLDQKIDQQLYR